MRILAITHSYPRWDGDVAGAFIERLVHASIERGHAVTVLVPADEGKGGTADRRGSAVKRIRYAPARWETLAYRGTMVEASRSVTGFVALLGLIVGLVVQIRAESRDTGPAVVHAHWWMPAGLAAWVARMLGGPPYVVTLHGTDVAVLRRSRLGRAVARRIFERAAAVTAVSSYLADRAASHTGFARADIVVQPMPVDVDRFKKQSIGGSGAVTVGRLVPQKRIGLVIDAIARLNASGQRVRLTIVGDGRERSALEQRARDSGIADTTRFLGAVAPERIPEVLGDADVFVFPAEAEGFGLAIVEALMAGVPVVATADGGGAAEAVPRTEAGHIVDVASGAELAASIQAVMKNHESRRLAREAGSRLREELCPDRVAGVFETIYARAAGVNAT